MGKVQRLFFLVKKLNGNRKSGNKNWGSREEWASVLHQVIIMEMHLNGKFSAKNKKSALYRDECTPVTIRYVVVGGEGGN